MICTSHRHGTPDALFLSHVIFLAKSIHDAVELSSALAAFTGITCVNNAPRAHLRPFAEKNRA